MKTKPQKAGRLPAKPRSNTATITVALPAEQAAPWLALPKAERNRQAEDAFRHFIYAQRSKQEAAARWQDEQRAQAEFKQRRESMDCVINTFGSTGPVCVAIGRDQLTGRWLKVQLHRD